MFSTPERFDGRNYFWRYTCCTPAAPPTVAASVTIPWIVNPNAKGALAPFKLGIRSGIGCLDAALYPPRTEFKDQFGTESGSDAVPFANLKVSATTSRLAGDAQFALLFYSSTEPSILVSARHPTAMSQAWCTMQMETTIPQCQTWLRSLYGFLAQNGGKESRQRSFLRSLPIIG